MQARSLCVAGILALSGAAASAQLLANDERLTHIRITSPKAREIAQRFETSGFDVVEGSVRPDSLEVIASNPSLKLIQDMGIDYRVIAVSRPYQDIQRELLAGDGPGIPTGYSNLAQINAQLGNRADSFPAICKLVDLTAMLGTPATAEGRHMMAVKVSDNVQSDEDEPVFVLVACHHAREINAPVVALDNLDRLLNGYGVNQQITDLVNKYEIWICPVWNPDGYNYVFTVNNMWRKNRRPNAGGSFGVDQNRNYPFGWTAACSGSTTASSDTYKGPSAGSEPETQTMRALGLTRNVAKIIDYHSSGRETLYGYLCLTHPLNTFLTQEATALSTASGYLGAVREPSAEGEDQESHVAFQGAHGFLTEIGTAFQPTYASAQAEAAQVWGGTLWLLNRAIPLSGHVTDSISGLPVNAAITYSGVNYLNGETNNSRGLFGRYQAFLPAGSYTINYTASGYQPASRIVTITSNTERIEDVALVPLAPPCYANCDGSTIAPILNVNDFSCFLNKYAAGDPAANCDASTIAPVLNVNDFSCFTNRFAAGCP